MASLRHLAYPLVEFPGSSEVASRNRSQRIQATNAASAVTIGTIIPAQPRPDRLRLPPSGGACNCVLLRTPLFPRTRMNIDTVRCTRVKPPTASATNTQIRNTPKGTLKEGRLSGNGISQGSSRYYLSGRGAIYLTRHQVLGESRLRNNDVWESTQRNRGSNGGPIPGLGMIGRVTRDVFG